MASKYIIKDGSGTVKSGLVALKEYFGMGVNSQGNPRTLSEFNAEIKALTPADREELELGAAEQLGYTVEVTA